MQFAAYKLQKNCSISCRKIVPLADSTLGGLEREIVAIAEAFLRTCLKNFTGSPGEAICTSFVALSVALCRGNLRIRHASLHLKHRLTCISRVTSWFVMLVRFILHTLINLININELDLKEVMDRVRPYYMCESKAVNFYKLKFQFKSVGDRCFCRNWYINTNYLYSRPRGLHIYKRVLNLRNL